MTFLTATTSSDANPTANVVISLLVYIDFVLPIYYGYLLSVEWPKPKQNEGVLCIYFHLLICSEFSILNRATQTRLTGVLFFIAGD